MNPGPPRWARFLHTGRWLFLLMPAASALAGLQWEKTELAFKPSLAELKTVAVFPFRNAGEKTVKILQIKPSCDCLMIAGDRAEFRPGEEGKVTVTFEYGNRHGNFRQDILVLTDEPEAEPYQLSLTTEIPALILVEPPHLLWLEEDALIPKSVRIHLHPDAGTLVLNEEEEAFFRTELRRENVTEYVLKVTPKEPRIPVSAAIPLHVSQAKFERNPSTLRVLIR